MTTPLMGWLSVNSPFDAYEVKEAAFVKMAADKSKVKMIALLANIKTIKIRVVMILYMIRYCRLDVRIWHSDLMSGKLYF